ncbi:hypothetical protein GGF50DRAFT_112524 [Schizophyllum commune]
MPSFECPVCSESYGPPASVKIFPACGDHICARCAEQQLWIRCPTCRARAVRQPRGITELFFDDGVHESEAAGTTSSDAVPPNPQVESSDRADRVQQDNISGDDSQDTLDSRVERARNALEALSTRPPSDYDTFQAILGQVKAVLIDCRIALSEREQLRLLVDTRSALVEAVENEKRLLKRLVEVKQRLIQENEESGRLKIEALAACRNCLEAETEKASGSAALVQKVDLLQAQVQDVTEQRNAMQKLFGPFLVTLLSK